MYKRLLFGALLVCSTTSFSDGDFFFEEEVITQRLEESVISTEGFETTIRNTPKNITIVTSQDIKEKGARDIGDALEGVSGVKVSRSFGQISIDLRGQGSTNGSNTLILIDGIRQNPIDMGGARLNGISVESIERIEVLPGGGSVLYGDGAVGGIVNIITKSNVSIDPINTIYSEVGNNGYFKFGVNQGIKLNDKTLIQVNYEDSSSDGYRDNGDLDTENIDIALKHIINDDSTIGIKYSHSEEEYGLAGALTRQEIDEDRQKTNSPNDTADYTRDSYSINYNHKLTNSIEFNLDGNYSEAEYASAGSSKTEYDLKEMSIKPKLKITYLEDSNVIFGYDFYQGESHNTYSWNSKINRELEKKSQSTFILNTVNWNDIQFTQGFRYEKTEYDLNANGETNWDGSAKTYKEDSLYNTSIDLGINYFYSDTGSIYTTYTQGFRTPNTDELALASDDLKEQTHEYIELGLKDIIFNSYVSASIFKFTGEDEIYYDPTANNYAGANTNLEGESEKLGFELFAEQYFGKLTINQSFTYLDTEMQNGVYEGMEIPGISKYMATLGAKYQFKEAFIFNINSNFYGKSYAYSDFDNSLDKVNDYITVDTEISYSFKNGLKLYAGINNVFNEIHYDYVSDSTWSGSSDGKTYYPASEREYYTGLRYTF